MSDLIIYTDSDGMPWAAFVWGSADPATVSAMITPEAVEAQTGFEVDGCGDRAGRQEASVRAFREWIDPGEGKQTLLMERQFVLCHDDETTRIGPSVSVGVAPSICDVRSALRGKSLAFWCKPGAPCHADVLLELANA